MSDCDATVICRCSPGENGAVPIAEGGARGALRERDLVGCGCSSWACVPSKSLLRPGDAVHHAQEPQ